MIISFIKTYNGTDITEISATIDDVKEMISSPSTFSKGDYLWKFSSFKEHVRANVNGITRYALELDFDSGMTIEYFENRYKSLEYYLYTTPSHSTNQNKFRVILPINPEPYSVLDNSQAKRAALKDYFKSIDSTCISNFQNVPSLTDSYYYKFNEGVKFSWQRIQSQITANLLKAKPTTKSIISRKPQSYVDKVVSSLIELGRPLDFSSNKSNSGKITNAKGQPAGSDYYMFRFVSLLYDCGLSKNEIQDIFNLNFRPNSKRESEFNHKLSEVF